MLAVPVYNIAAADSLTRRNSKILTRSRRAAAGHYQSLALAIKALRSLRGWAWCSTRNPAGIGAYKYGDETEST